MCNDSLNSKSGYTHLCVHNYISPKTVEKEEEMQSPTLLPYTGHILVYQCQQCNCFVWSGNALAAFKSKTGALQMEQVLALNVLHAFQKVTAKLFWKKNFLKVLNMMLNMI